MICHHPADSRQAPTLLLTCPDCGAECSRTQVGEDQLCYDQSCPLHVLAGGGPPLLGETD